MRSIWKIALSTFLILFVTLLLFPGITSDIQNCDIQDWPPVIMAAVFNVFDGISRVRTSDKNECTGRHEYTCKSMYCAEVLFKTS